MLKKLILKWISLAGYTIYKNNKLSQKKKLNLKRLSIVQISRIVDFISFDPDKINFINLYAFDETNFVYNIKDDLSFIEALRIFRKNELSELGEKQLLMSQRNLLQTISQSQRNYDKIHYGSGINILANWLNTDFLDLDFENYIQLDLCDKQPFPENSISFAFSEDFLEHLSQEDSIFFLTEVFAVLKMGGVLRLSFPGLEGVLKTHLRNEKFRHFNLKLEAYKFWGHLHFYSREELTLVAQSIGFSKIEFVEYGKSSYSELQNLETRFNQIGLNIYVELTK
jgi:predicted SAM-dependent methyltransferase